MRPTVQQARAALLVSIFMTMLGTCGVANGVAGASQSAIPASSAIEDVAAPEDAFASAQTALAAEVLWGSPYRRQVAAANAVVSAMLLVGSFLLTFRRPNALWWIRNTIAANLLVIVGGYAHDVARLLAPGPELRAAIDAVLASQGSPPGLDARAAVLSTIVGLGIGVLLRALLHVAILWRAHRPDIRAFIESGAEGD